MTDTPLTRDNDARTTRSSGAPRLIAAAIALLVLAAIAAGAWWYFMGRTPAPEWPRIPDIVLKAPAGDAFRDDTPWVTFAAAPMAPGETNTMRLSLASRQGTPVAAGESAPRIVGLTAVPLSGDGAPRDLPLQADPGAEGSLATVDALDVAGWWQFDVAVEGADADATFYLLLPDPNINGPAAVANGESSAEGEALYQRGMSALTSLQSVRYQQWLADGLGNAGVSDHAVSAGGDGAPPGFIYRAAGGMEAIIIESTRWVKPPGAAGWTRQEGALSVPPSEWGEEYLGATGFTVLGEETIDGATAQMVAFVVPEVTEPRRQTGAWYLWWVANERGYLLREVMISRVHYMVNTFSDFDAPVALTPPDEPATPAAATPTG